MRYQQVFLSSDWDGNGADVLIDEISFRSREPIAAPGEDAIIADVTIALSTTEKQPLGLSHEYALNVGDDEVVVRSGPLVVESLLIDNPPVPSVPYETRIRFDRYFRYQPSLGNLLIDLRTSDGLRGLSGDGFDAVYNRRDVTSRIYGRADRAVSGATVANQATGLVTVFGFSAVPEPTSLTSLLFAVACVMASKTSVREAVSTQVV